MSLVPSQSFRANYRAVSLKLPIHASHRELTGEAQMILHTILTLLLRLLRPARAYTEIIVHGPNKLSAYFSLMTYCMVSKTEKIMVCCDLSACSIFFCYNNNKSMTFSVESIYSNAVGSIPSAFVGAQCASASQ